MAQAIPAGMGSVVVFTPSPFVMTFAAAEDPLRSGGWTHLDPLLTDVKVEQIGGVYVAHGTQVGGPNAPYDDSNVYLPQLASSHSIEATVWVSSGVPSAPPNCEVELLLRWTDDNPVRATAYGDTHADGYEININQSAGYLQVGRFKGALLASSSNGVPTAATGDKFRAQIEDASTGSVRIRCWWNDVLKIDYTDPSSNNPPTRGGPGIGFYRSAGGPNDKFGFTAVKANNL